MSTKPRPSLSRLLERVESGEEIIIARAGKPVARLVALTQETARSARREGSRGRSSIPDSFFEPMT